MLTPGNRAERIAKAAGLPVDGVAVDLEDGVGPDQKAEARAAMVTAFRTLDFGPRERIVRINAVGTEAFEADIQALPVGLIDTVFVPKVEDGDQLRRLDEALERAERDAGRARPLDVIATIQPPRGMAAIRAGSSEWTVPEAAWAWCWPRRAPRSWAASGASSWSSRMSWSREAGPWRPVWRRSLTRIADWVAEMLALRLMRGTLLLATVTPNRATTAVSNEPRYSS